MRRKHVIGLTGNIATGKSTVVRMLEELGAEAIDGDAIAHQLMGPGSPLAGEIRAAFGEQAVNSDGSINRPELGKVVFSDPVMLQRLEEIVWPTVLARKREAINQPGPDVLILDAIKLFESGMAEECDEVWVVTSPREVQIARIIARNKVDRAEAERRIDAQPPQSEKVARADLVLDNSGSLGDLERQVQEAWRRLVGAG
ncbi:MAG TPA: dephospho-CoA kinase [Thermomicrobiales bacterium]|nr:dephospho-CoA kinase [Thermomicrobiales bacterium]